MQALNSFLTLIFFTFSAGMLSGGLVITIQKKQFVFSLFIFCLFLVCLKAIFDLIQTLQIDPINLLQIDATLITGALILLTISSFVSKKSHKPILTRGIKRSIAWTPYGVGGGAILAFGLSAMAVFFDSSFAAAQIFTIIGFGWLMLSSFVLVVKEPIGESSEDE